MRCRYGTHPLALRPGRPDRSCPRRSGRLVRRGELVPGSRSATRRARMATKRSSAADSRLFRRRSWPICLSLLTNAFRRAARSGSARFAAAVSPPAHVAPHLRRAPGLPTLCPKPQSDRLGRESCGGAAPMQVGAAGTCRQGSARYDKGDLSFQWIFSNHGISR